MSVNQRAVNALRGRIADGAFVPSGKFPYARFAAGVSQEKLAEQREAYRKEARRLEQTEFRTEALVAVGLENHPKANKAWDLAWERGHSDGLEEVLVELIDLADLLS